MSSLNSLRVTKLINTAATARIDQKITRLWAMIRLASPSIGPLRSGSSSTGLTRIGSISVTPGSSTSDHSIAPSTPNPTDVPSSRNGGESEKFRLKKPIAVVMEVRNTGLMLIISACSMA